MKRIFLNSLGLIGLTLTMAGPSLMADRHERWEKTDQDEMRRDRDHGKKYFINGRDRKKRDAGDDYRYSHYDRWDDRRYRRPVRLDFDHEDRRYLHDYFRHYDNHFWVSHYPSHLPPGYYKKLVVHSHVPYEVRGYLVPFPVEVERRLCPLPRNYMRFMFGSRGLIVDAQFNIVDLFDLR